MRANAHSGGATGLNARLFGIVDSDRAILESFIPPSTLHGTSEFFNNSIVNLNAVYHSNEAMQVARNMTMSMQSIYGAETLMYIDYDTLPRANNLMKDIILSHPEVNRLNTLGYIDGYPTAVADPYLYDYVTSGLVTIKDNYIEYRTVSDIHYDEQYTDSDVEVIQNCWRAVSDALLDGLDPTSDELRPF